MDSKYSKRKGLGVFVQTAQNEFLSFVPLYNLYFGCLVNLLQVSPPKISDWENKTSRSWLSDHGFHSAPSQVTADDVL